MTRNNTIESRNQLDIHERPQAVVLEDNTSWQEALREVLQALGYDVFTYSTIAQSLGHTGAVELLTLDGEVSDCLVAPQVTEIITALDPKYIWIISDGHRATLLETVQAIAAEKLAGALNKKLEDSATPYFHERKALSRMEARTVREQGLIISRFIFNTKALMESYLGGTYSDNISDLLSILQELVPLSYPDHIKQVTADRVITAHWMVNHSNPELVARQTAVQVAVQSQLEEFAAALGQGSESKAQEIAANIIRTISDFVQKVKSENKAEQR
jgi:hypothetical protein